MNKIRMKLEGDGTLNVYKNIDIKVSQGIVTLKGSVDRQKDAQDLKSKVEDVEGVKRVNDKLELNDRMNNDRMNNKNPRNNNIPTDRELTQKAQEAFKSGTFTKGYENVAVSVRDGRATLKGTVNSDSDRMKVQDMVQKMDGIESVDNQVTVKAV
jgi:osmotically-inducible protein OsmY